MMEVWKSIEDYAGYYEVSDLGNVRSIERVITQVSRKGTPYQRTMKSKAITGFAGSSGRYRVVHLTRVLAETCLVHLLVLRAFIGPPPSGCEACHNDGNSFNNALTNLRWDTHISNEADRRAHGTVPRGENHYAATLTQSQVDSIRKDLTEYRGRAYGRHVVIGNVHGVSPKTVCDIATGKRWAHAN